MATASKSRSNCRTSTTVEEAKVVAKKFWSRTPSSKQVQTVQQFMNDIGREPRETAEIAAYGKSRKAFAQYLEQNPVQKAAPAPMPKKTAEAPTKPDTHLPAPEAAQAAKRLTTEKVKSALKVEQEATLARLTAGELLNRGQLASLTATQLQGYCKANREKYTGYSSLSKDELVEYIHTGMKPGPKAGSVRDLKEQAQALKASGKVVGAVSALNKAALTAIVRAASSGETVEVTKPDPKVGTVDWMKGLCREHGITKYSALKKADLVAHIKASGKAAAIDALAKAGL